MLGLLPNATRVDRVSHHRSGGGEAIPVIAGANPRAIAKAAMIH